MDDRDYLGKFFRNLQLAEIEPTSEFYVPLWQHQPTADPVSRMSNTILYAEGRSAQLLSGYRGAGKSTELRRLRQELRNHGYQVVLCDMEAYLNTKEPIGVSEFLLALAPSGHQ